MATFGTVEGSNNTTMNIPFDEEERLISVIQMEARACISDIHQIRDDVKTEIENHRCGLTPAKDILKKDFDEYVQNVRYVQRNFSNVDGTTFDGLITALLLPWRIFCLILEIFYYFFILGRKYFGERKFEVSFSTVDHAFIDEQYLICCSENWIHEVENFIDENREIFTPERLEDFLNSVEIIHDLSQIRGSLRELKYYKLLMKIRHRLLSKDREEALMKTFKRICLEQVIIHSQAFKAESYFIDSIVTFFRATKNIRYIIDKLQLKEFCSGELLLDGLIENILNWSKEDQDADVTGLQEAASSLKEDNKGKNPFLTKTSINLIKAFVEPVEIKRKTSDGRSVIEVTGKVVVLGDILSKLETSLVENPNIDEVRFVGCDVMHIDRDLDNLRWHGINIVVLSTFIRIHDQVTWNVSGKDNDHVYRRNASTDRDGNGKQGADGYAGESGGNVLIVADELSHPENFTIISNGGNGSAGQDGGNGKPGEDGKGIAADQFDEQFPSPVRVLDVGHERRDETVRRIRQLAEGDVDHWDLNFPNTFIDVVTKENKQITFSYASGKATLRQAFLLCRGSLGQRGGDGGECGLGGQGGCNGEIITSHRSIAVRSIPGENGKMGKGGLYGDHGKNGHDMGYTDSQKWLISRTQFHGTDERSKLQLKYHDSGWFSAPGSAVWCPRRCGYVEITRGRIEHREGTQYQERKTRLNNELQRQALATKKKSISQGKILADYSHCFTAVEGTMSRSSQSGVENVIQRAMRELDEIAKQQEKATTELKVKHLVASLPRDKNVRRVSVVYRNTSNSHNQPDIRSLIREVTGKAAVDNLNELPSFEMTRCELLELFCYLDFSGNRELSGEPENDRQRIVEQLLIEKYRFAVLREIARNEMLPGNYFDDTDNATESTADCATRYLVEAERNVTNISHRILGTLDQYFYTNGVEQREKMCKYCDEISLDVENDEPLRYSIREFVLKAEKSKRVDPNVRKYCIEYKDFVKKQLHDMNIVLESFLAELEKHKDMHDLWVRGNNDDSLRFEFNRRIENREVLKVLYRCLSTQLRQTYDWRKCWGDDNFLEEYYDDIRKRGPLSEICRELLARVFEVNIRFYSQDQDSKFHLVDNHRPSAKRAIHILNGENSLRQLKIDTNFLGLSRKRAKSGNIYAQILAKTDRFVDRQEFDDYFETKTFLRHDVIENYVSQQSENLSEEQAILEIIKYLSCPDERLRMKERLLKISSQYVGHNRILPFILKRFSSDGRHVSYQELCSLVNSVLASVVDDKNDLNIFCWIVAAYPQDKWTSELVLLQIENHLRIQITDKSKWRDDLSRVTDKNVLMLFKSKLIQHKSDRSISVEFIEDVVRLLSSIPNDLVNLDGIELLEWPCAMKEKYWHHKVSPLANAGQEEDDKLSRASYYLLSMENIFGTSLVTKFIDIFVGKKPSLDVLADTLSNFCTENWNLSEDGVQSLSTSSSVTEWTEIMSMKFLVEKKDRDVTRLVEIIKGNANTSKNIIDQLPVIEYSILREHTANGGTESSMMRLVKWVRDTNNYQKELFDDSAGIRGAVCVICQKEQNSGMTDYEIERTDFRRLYYRIIYPGYWRTYLERESDPQFLDEARTDMLAAIDKEVESIEGFNLRDTQKVAILALLANERNTLAQVSTGEGKTLIVMVASIMKALHGEKVHIVTSSSVLAKRDAAANRDIYGLFGIRVSHNCSEDLDERKVAYSGSQVVYGDLSSFQRDYLLDKFYGKNILGDSSFENVFADEVDSMLLDKGKNMLYLSHDLAGLDKLESLYLYIWQSVNRPTRSLEDYDSISNDKAIKESVLDDLYGLLKKEDIQKIDPELNEQQVKLVWDGLINAKILDKEGKMLTERILDEELEAVLSPDFGCYKNRISFLLKERIGRAKCIHVPNYLKPFIEQHLESWIKSAKTAVEIQSGHDYVMDVDRTGNSQDLNANVTIVDRDTGTDQTNSQWDEALHQFLQLKHGCKLSIQSLKAVFISNVSYLKLYRNLYGLTGTLGSQRERALLMKIHDVDFVTIPTAKSKQFLEEPPIICGDKKQWVQEIFNESIEFARGRKRSVLIICETIDAAQTLHKNFKDKRTDHVHLYTRDHEEFDIAQGTSELDQGQIIIATNLSGRGTDIRITEGLKEAGGLHVCLTYLPDNNRIEEQAFGRAARNGDKGSGRLIIVESGVGKHGIANIFDLKKNRDNEESQRISVLEAYYKSQIVTEERCFKIFEKQFRKLSKNLKASKEVDNEVTEIVLQTSIDLWAFWLDKNSECIKHVTDEENRRNLNNRLDEFISQLEDFEDDGENIHWQSWVETQPIQMIKIGKCFCRMKKYDAAIALFDRAIELEPNFSEAAHYYKGFTLMRKLHSVDKSSRKQFLKEVKTELREASKIFDDLSERSIYAGGAVRAIRKYDEQTSIIQIDTYAEQQKSVANLYKNFSQSIDDIFDKPITPESFINADISGKLSQVIYTNLRLHKILRNLKIKMSITEETWNNISLDSLDGTSVGELKDCLISLRGREIDENMFPKILKQHVKLPSREDFWKLSIELGIFRQEVKYVLVDVQELDKLDPTLWELLRGIKELRRPALKSDEANGIILYPELSEPHEGCVILEKITLQKVLTKNNRRYEFLEDKGVFSVYKRAIVDSSKISSTSLPRYDAIALQDFISADIPEDDARKILAELVEQNVLILPDGIYRLGIPSDSIPLIRLSSYPVYESVVKKLLSRCFIYRITLEIIEKQLQRGDSAYPRLRSHPHVELIYELLDQRIIKPVTLKREPHQLIADLRGVFNRTITQRDLEILFPRNGLIWDKSNGEKLCEDLVEKKWLSLHQPSDDKRSDRFNRCIQEVLSCSGTRYTINDSIHRREALGTPFRSVEQKLGQIFNDRLQLAEKSTINHIVEVLKRSRSPLKTLGIPDGSLNALTQHRGLEGSRHIEEVSVFTLNGLDQILLLEERKWSKMTMINAGITVGMGVSQVAVGAVIESLFGEASACAAVSCIGEGIGDIIFAINSYRSGHFSWKAYGRHKIRSLRLTATATSLGSVFAAGAVLDGTGITAATGRELIETVGLSRVVMSVGRSVASHTARAAAIGFSYTEIDVIIQDFGERIRDGLSSAFLSGITSKMDEHDVGTSLEMMYRSLGREQAMAIIKDVTRSSLNETSLNAKYLPIVTQSVKGVRKAMKEVTKRMGQGGENALSFVSRISSYVLAALPWAERAAYVVDVRNITGHVLDGMEKKLKHAIRTHEMENPSRQQRVAFSERLEDSEEFKREVIEHWNSVICEKAGEIIEKHVVRPVIIKGLGSIMMLCDKIIERECRTYNVGWHNRFSEEERRRYRENKRHGNTSTADAVRVDELAERQVNEYQKTLGKLLAKTSNHRLSADARMQSAVPRKRVIQLSDNKLWKEIDLDETVMFPIPRTSAEHPCTRRQTLERSEIIWHDEPFYGVTTSDGFVLLYNSRSVAAAICKSDNRRLQIISYEEIGQSRSEYNSWRKNSKEAIAIVMARHDLSVDADVPPRKVKMERSVSFATDGEKPEGKPVRGKRKKNRKPKNRSEDVQVFCTFCERNNHSTEECRSRWRNEVFCTYCKQNGHTYKYCRYLARHEQSNLQDQFDSESSESCQTNNRQRNHRSSNNGYNRQQRYNSLPNYQQFQSDYPPQYNDYG